MKRAWSALAVISGLLILFAAWGLWAYFGNRNQPILVGILHSQTGPMAISEQSMIDAEILALEEINAQGGLLGRPVKWVVADGKSDPPTFQRQAERLIQDDKVSVIIGCWTSASRKMVKPIVEANHHLLVYPMAYEGLEESPNIVYTGAAPNQQIIPAVKWAHDTLKARRFFVVGSDYVWPHAVNEIAKDQIHALGDEIAGEEYIFFGSTEVDDAVSKIVAAKPDVILSTVVGDTNLSFYSKLRASGLDPSKVPVITFSIAEDELRKLSPDDVAGNYASWDYFQSIDTPENQEFVSRFRARYGEDRVTSDVIESAYESVMIWAQAVEEAGDSSVDLVRKTIAYQSRDAPEGVVSIDRDTQHTWRPMYIAKIRPDSQFEIVWSSGKPTRPIPYPNTRTRAQWDKFMNDLYTGWNNSWSNPVPPKAKASAEGK
jgi:urea transport system substrate-binding protein